MNKSIRFILASAAVFMLAGAMSFAQSAGEATYKTKCQSCHGAAGIPSPAMAKAMGVKPVTDPAVKSSTAATMIASTKNGMGKMPAFKDKLTDAQITDSVTYFRSFTK